jgi:hypothetical protein
MSHPGRQGRGARDTLPWLVALVVLASLAIAQLGADTFQLGSADGSFETGLAGMVTEGDVSVVPSFGIVFPTEGNRALLMTTEPDSGSTPADADTSSVRIEGFTVRQGSRRSGSTSTSSPTSPCPAGRTMASQWI